MGIPRQIIEHRLSVDPTRKPVKQKKCTFGPERSLVIEVEVDKLLGARIIREVDYQEWLANPVLVQKSNGEWRMCFDFTDLNKACPKDLFPVPRIDVLVDSIAGFRFMCFLDAYKGYHQIFLKEEDEEKTAFTTDKGTYCYITMPFGLKNAEAKYQKLVNKIFKAQLGRNMEGYIDDMLVKSRDENTLISDLTETFETLRLTRLRLNPKKCVFGASSRKFLGYMVSKTGISANKEKVEAVLQMKSPESVREVQLLTGRLVALNRFLSKSAERALPFFKVLKKSDKFEWTEECQQAFEDLKKYLAGLPGLAMPEVGERLYLYLAVTAEAISSVLVREEERAQKPVYYVSKVLQSAEKNYSDMEKLVFAIVVTARRLQSYFEAHSVSVLTNRGNIKYGQTKKFVILSSKPALTK